MTRPSLATLLMAFAPSMGYITVLLAYGEAVTTCKVIDLAVVHSHHEQLDKLYGT